MVENSVFSREYSFQNVSDHKVSILTEINNSSQDCLLQYFLSILILVRIYFSMCKIYKCFGLINVYIQM